MNFSKTQQNSFVFSFSPNPFRVLPDQPQPFQYFLTAKCMLDLCISDTHSVHSQPFAVLLTFSVFCSSVLLVVEFLTPRKSLFFVLWDGDGTPL